MYPLSVHCNVRDEGSAAIASQYTLYILTSVDETFVAKSCTEETACQKFVHVIIGVKICDLHTSCCVNAFALKYCITVNAFTETHTLGLCPTISFPSPITSNLVIHMIQCDNLSQWPTLENFYVTSTLFFEKFHTGIKISFAYFATY